MIDGRTSYSFKLQLLILLPYVGTLQILWYSTMEWSQYRSSESFGTFCCVQTNCLLVVPRDSSFTELKELNVKSQDIGETLYSQKNIFWCVVTVIMKETWSSVCTEHQLIIRKGIIKDFSLFVMIIQVRRWFGMPGTSCCFSELCQRMCPWSWKFQLGVTSLDWSHS